MFNYADYIYEIYTEKSFTAAAKKLYVSQPALSATVKKLEEELGVNLFDRTSSPIKLTPEGEEYIKAVEKINRIKSNLLAYFMDSSELNVGSVSVCGANFISSFVMPEIVLEFSKSFPNVMVELIESDSPKLQEKILSEEIELMLDYSFDTTLFERYPLYDEHLLLCVPRKASINFENGKLSLSYADILNDKHKNPDFPCVNLADFSKEKFIMLKKGNDTYYRSTEICKEYGFSPNGILHLDQLITSYNVARSGMGIAFVTDTVIRSVPSENELVYYKIKSPYTIRTLYIAHKKRKYISRAMKEFINTAVKVYVKPT